MAKLTKEEIQALVRVAGGCMYHTIKSHRVVSEFEGDTRDWEYITHTVEVWVRDRSGYPTGKARSKDETTAWRNAYKRYLKESKHG